MDSNLNELNPLSRWPGWTYFGRPTDLDVRNVLEACISKVPHQTEFDFFRAFDADAGLFLDVGANMGLTSLSLWLTNPSVEVLSLEPLPFLNPVLTRVCQMLPNRRCLEIGAGSTFRKATMHVPVVDGLMCTTWSTLEPETALAAKAAFWKQITGRDAIEVETFEVQLMDLDRLDLEPRFLKMNLEANGLAALSGMERTLEKASPILWLEHSSGSPAPEWLSARGYAPYHWSPAAGALQSWSPEMSFNIFYIKRIHEQDLLARGVL